MNHSVFPHLKRMPLSDFAYFLFCRFRDVGIKIRVFFWVLKKLQSSSPQAWRSQPKLIQIRTPKQHSSFCTDLHIHTSHQILSAGGSQCWQGSILRQNAREQANSEWDVDQTTTQFSLRDSAASEGSFTTPFSQCTQPKAIVINALARCSLVVLQALFEILDPQKHNNYQLRRNAFSSWQKGLPLSQNNSMYYTYSHCNHTISSQHFRLSSKTSSSSRNWRRTTRNFYSSNSGFPCIALCRLCVCWPAPNPASSCSYERHSFRVQSLPPDVFLLPSAAQSTANTCVRHSKFNHHATPTDQAATF